MVTNPPDGTVKLTEIGLDWIPNQRVPERGINNLAPEDDAGNVIKQLNLTIPTLNQCPLAGLLYWTESSE